VLTNIFKIIQFIGVQVVMKEGKEVRAVFLDISKAFDKVWHKGLISKLKFIGIKGT
jgi:hypothetical protein